MVVHHSTKFGYKRLQTNTQLRGNKYVSRALHPSPHSAIIFLNTDTHCPALIKAKSVYSPIINSCCLNCLTVLSQCKHYNCKPLKHLTPLPSLHQGSLCITPSDAGNNVPSMTLSQTGIHIFYVHGGDYKWHSLALLCECAWLAEHVLHMFIVSWLWRCTFFVLVSVMLQFCWLSGTGSDSEDSKPIRLQRWPSATCTYLRSVGQTSFPSLVRELMWPCLAHAPGP